jgi:predicted DNA repair protein MutK
MLVPSLLLPAGDCLLEPFDQLDLVAEIAVALLGFVAVFLAISKTDGRFAESDRHFIQAMVLSSALVIVLAIAPRSLSLFGQDTAVWTISAILALALGSVTISLQARQQLKMSRDEAAQIHWIWHIVAWVIAGLAALLFILALLDSSKTTAYYISGVSTLIPLCLWVFIGVVFRRFF